MSRLACVIAILGGGLALAGPEPKDKAAAYQKKADEAAWEWKDEQATLDFSIKRCKVKVEVMEHDFNQATIAVRADGKEPFAFEGHKGTSFVVAGTTLYYAKYSRVSTGCAVVAVDLGTGKQLWQARLKGIGPVSHFGYDNAVALDLDDAAARVIGNESKGRYIEFVDRQTGKTLGHKKFPKD